MRRSFSSRVTSWTRPRPLTAEELGARIARARHSAFRLEAPLTDYTEYQLTGYQESSAAGEDIRITNRAASPELAGLREDFWLLDEGHRSEAAMLMNYTDDGEFTGALLTRDGTTLRHCRQAKALAIRYSVPLNEYLATRQTVA